MFTRKLGRSEIEVSGLGIGCWAIGGPFTNPDRVPVGWGEVNDAESIRAIHRALDLGVTLLDTANVYGTGHSETLLGQALEGKRDQVVIATKFGYIFEEGSRHFHGHDASPAVIRQQCEDSLRRLRTDYIDLYQFHVGEYPADKAGPVRDTLEELVTEGKIRTYAWSTDDPDCASVFAEGPHCSAVQYRTNILERNLDMVALCEEHNLAGLIRGPLARGLLTGKFNVDSKLPANDVRHHWDFAAGEQAEWLATLGKIRDVMTRDGRTLAQAALGWLWALSPTTVPIPGFKTVQQIEENAGALQYGPLSDDQMQEIGELLGDTMFTIL
ncbi:MAG: aldo/keto reductase [Anaerolineae bacterium]|nr:aldo/keto reductase [Anaerolineae bacterium]